MGIKIENLNFSYSETDIFRDFSVEFIKGEFLTILGPNGCGKSTLVKNILRILKSNKGNILLDEKEISKIKKTEFAKEITGVMQKNDIEFDFKVIDFVMTGRYPYIKKMTGETKEDIKKVMEAMEITETIEFKDKNIKEISGGEYQRVVLARAIAQDTEYMLLDEPISNLDIHHQTEILSTLKKINKEKGITIITVLHDINTASNFSDKIYIMEKGKVMYYGTPDEVITKENIEKIYKIKVIKTEHPATGKPLIIPLYY